MRNFHAAMTLEPPNQIKIERSFIHSTSSHSLSKYINLPALRDKTKIYATTLLAFPLSNISPLLISLKNPKVYTNYFIVIIKYYSLKEGESVKINEVFSQLQLAK